MNPWRANILLQTLCFGVVSLLAIASKHILGYVDWIVIICWIVCLANVLFGAGMLYVTWED